MEVEKGKIYESASDYFKIREGGFDLKGTSLMKLSPTAATAVCEQASEHNLLVGKIEGGIWRSPGFEARLDCIWDGLEPVVDAEAARMNNFRATEFIHSESAVHDVFIITALLNRKKIYSF